MLTNQTPLPATTRPFRDHTGKLHLLVVAKGTWCISTGRLAPAEKQSGLNVTPLRVCIGDLQLDAHQRLALKSRLDEEIVWVNHDLSPPKPAFDVLVVGYATAPPAHPHPFLDAGIRVGSTVGTIRAFPPRYWHRNWLGHHAKAFAQTVGRVPINYAFADWTGGCRARSSHSVEEGYVACLPWIESLQTPSRYAKHARVPAGFGYWPESAPHRSAYAGTYNARWQRERSPDLPFDFDVRFFNEAHPSLQLALPPTAGTAIRLVHLGHDAIVDCSFPSLNLNVQACSAAGKTHAPVSMKPDTLIVEPDEDRLSIVWRILLDDGVQGNALRTVRLFKPGSSAK